MSIYSEKVMDHLRNPGHQGKIDDATAMADNGNPSCGDRLIYYLWVEDGKIVDIRHDAQGCAISRAAADILADMVVGRPVEEARKMTHDDIMGAMGGITEARRECATLSVDVLREALEKV